ncbi:MAG TPA: rhodanese-like domain-containing protein [Acidobacteriaceae bacterium]
MMTMSVVSPLEAQQGDWVILDVRSTSERATVCVAGSMHLPLESVESGVAQLQSQPGPIAVLCKGGTRAAMAQERLARCGVTVSVIEGGMDGWVRAGLPVTRLTVSSWSLERQVRFVAGLLVLCGTVAALVWGRGWLGVTGFVGAGLVFAGVTDTCMMGRLLARMPWNRLRSTA